MCKNNRGTLFFGCAFAAKTEASSVTGNINFGDIIQSSTTTIAQMSAGGGVSVSGGTADGTHSLGYISYTSTTTQSNYYDRIDGVTASGGSAETISEGCTAQVTSASLSEDKFSKFSIAAGTNRSCSNIPTSQSLPVKATLTLKGYCREGTYTLNQATYIFDNYCAMLTKPDIATAITTAARNGSRRLSCR